MTQTSGYTATKTPLVMAVYGPSKQGKALDEERTHVLTPTGYRALRDLVVDDRVCHPSGGTSRVTGVYPQGLRPGYEFVFGDGTAATCDEEHLWSVAPTCERDKWRVKLAHEIVDEGVLYDREDHRPRWLIPMTQPLQFAAGETLPLDPYTLGALLGDGHFGRGASISTDAEIVAMLQLPEAVRAVASKDDRQQWYLFATAGRGASNPLLNILDQLNLRWHLAHEKFIPACYLLADPAARLALLQGLLDTDGGVEETDRIVYATASPRLRDDVRQLVESLGGCVRVSCKQEPRYTYRGVTKIGRPSHRLSIMLPKGMLPFRLARKAARYNPDKKKSPTRALVAVRHVGMRPMRCISVDAPDGLFLIDNCVVTHNTWFAAGAPNPVFISPAAERGWTALPQHPNWKNITVLTVPPMAGYDEIGEKARPSAYVPPVGPIEAMQDIIIPKIKSQWFERDWRTIVIDTASIYADMVVSQMSAYGKSVMQTRGTDNDWIKLQQHFLNIRNDLQGLPLHVIWLFHAKESELAGKLRPAMIGAAMDKHILPTCAVVAYLDRRVVPVDAAGQPLTDPSQAAADYKHQRFLWTSCPANYTPAFEAGTRYEDLLPAFMPAEWSELMTRLSPVIMTNEEYETMYQKAKAERA